MDKWDPSAEGAGVWKQKEAQMERKGWSFGRTLKRRDAGTGICLPAKILDRFKHSNIHQPPLVPFADANTHAGALCLQLENYKPKFKRSFSEPRVLPLAKGPGVRKQRAVRLQTAWMQKAGQPKQALEVPYWILKAKSFVFSLKWCNVDWRVRGTGKTSISYLSTSLRFSQTPSPSLEVGFMVPGGRLCRCSGALSRPSTLMPTLSRPSPLPQQLLGAAFTLDPC